MSLFKLKTIWNASFPQQQFDQRHLAFGNIDKKPAIAVGSFKGMMRVFVLNSKASSANQFFTQIFQKSFDQPIIDVKFVAHPDQSIRGNTLGLLLFKRFIYLSLQSNSESSIYSSKLMNVQVQASFAIIPSPLSLATINSSIQSMNPKQIHPIKQSDPIYPFTLSQENLYYMDGEDLVKVKGNIEQWRIILGRVRSLFLIRDILVVIGELNLWQVDEGKIIKTKKLQEQVSAGALAFKKNQEFNIIVCNFLMQMLIYTQDYTLLWAVKLDYVPIRIIISQNQLLRGAMIFLTDQGSIELTYAGTQIQERSLKPLEQQVNIERVEKQTQYFLQKLKEMKQNPMGKKNQITKIDESSSSSNLSIKLSFSQPEQTSQFVDNNEQFYRSPKSNKIIKCTMMIQLMAQSVELNGIIINVIRPSNIFCRNQEIQLDKLKGKEILKVDFFISKEKFPYETKIKVNLRYQKGKAIKLVEKAIDIPIAFQCQLDSFESLDKSADQKITFKCTDNPLPAFNHLFADIMQRGCGQQKKAITFTLANGVKSSIVYNKNLAKVKIQSQVYSGLCFAFLQFMKRIESYLQKSNQKLTAIQIEVSLKELQQQIRDYHTSREQLRNQYKKLQQKTEQFKKTQKKLLLKMKEKNSSIEHINTLLGFTYSKILESAKKYEQILQQTSIVNHNFEIGLKFVMEMVYRRSAATLKARQAAESIVAFDSHNQCILDEQGWAERLAKNTAFYLNKKYDPTVQNLEKLVTWVITKVNNGQWNS